MKLIKQLLQDGVPFFGVELIDNRIFYVVDTGMKSTLKLHPLKNHRYDVRTRYNKSEEEFHSTEDVINYIFLHCMCGRDYMSCRMEELVKKYVPEYIRERYK